MPRRRQSITDDPRADVNHREHAKWIADLLRDLDDHTHTKALKLTKVAEHDGVLFSHAQETLIQSYTESLSLQHTAYLFDLATFLISRLEAMFNAGSCAMQAWTSYNADCKRLKDEKYIANMLHLLRRLQCFLFQILIHRSLKRLDEYARHGEENWDRTQAAKKLDEDWFSEWPSGRRPLSTTWPWNIRPSLVVLWVSA